MNVKFVIRDDILYRETTITELSSGPDYYVVKQEPIIDKETFLLLYEKWIKEEKKP